MLCRTRDSIPEHRRNGQSLTVLVPYKEVLPSPFKLSPKEPSGGSCLLSSCRTLGASCSRPAGLHRGREPVGHLFRQRWLPAYQSLVTDRNPQFLSSLPLPCSPVPGSYPDSPNQVPDSLQSQLHIGAKEPPNITKGRDSPKVAEAEFSSIL